MTFYHLNQRHPGYFNWSEGRLEAVQNAILKKTKRLNNRCTMNFYTLLHNAILKKKGFHCNIWMIMQILISPVFTLEF